MITRAQAEALLTLAESLEACERLGVQINHDEEGLSVFYGVRGRWLNIHGVTSVSMRMAISVLAPKSET